MPVRRLIVALAALALVGYTGPRTPGPEFVFEEVPIRDVNAVDILFVIDDTPGLNAEQAIVAQQSILLFGELIAPTPTADGVLPMPVSSLHVGVVTPDQGAGGYAVPTCDGAGDDGALENRE
jgi:hypothetical protein